MNLGLHDLKEKPHQAQIQSFRYTACMANELMNKLDELKRTIVGQHERIKVLEREIQEVSDRSIVEFGHNANV